MQIINQDKLSWSEFVFFLKKCLNNFCGLDFQNNFLQIKILKESLEEKSFLFADWLTQPGPLSEILNIANLRQDASRT